MNEDFKMTNEIKDDIRISQMANGFVVEPDTVFSKSDCYVFQSFESMVEWLRQYYMDDGKYQGDWADRCNHEEN